MKTEDEIRDRLALELMAQTIFESHDSHAARAAEERVKILTWVLENTDPATIPPEPGGNGAAEAE